MILALAKGDKSKKASETENPRTKSASRKELTLVSLRETPDTSLFSSGLLGAYAPPAQQI